jgi:hypothetical protein
MAARVYLVEDGYAIKGAEPPGLRKQPAPIKIMFWGWLMEAALKAKDRDLSMGLDKDGQPLRPITAHTRKHRKSVMTPTGKGDPSAPPLMPGRKLSRVRSLLTGRAEVDHAEFWWKFDPFTHESFAKILEKEKDEGRDVFGLSPAALKRSMSQAWDRYAKWERGQAVEMPIVIGVPQAPPVIAASGGKRVEDWEKLLRRPKRTTLPAQGEGEFNVLLSHIFKVERPGGPPPVIKPTPPKPGPIQVRRAALKPLPRPKPKPVPPVSPTRPAASAPGSFATIEQVREWAAGAFPNFKAHVFDGGGVPLRVWNRVAPELDRLARDFPGVARRLEYLNDPSVAWGDPRYAGSAAVGDNKAGRHLSFNPRYFARPDAELQEDRRQAAESGWMAAGFEADAVATHEWGHLLESWLYDADPRLRSALLAVFRAGEGFDVDKASTVSVYAATNETEAFAEAFAAMRRLSPGDWAAAVREFAALLGRVGEP